MTPRIDEFWELVETTRGKASRDLHKQVKVIKTELLKKSATEICELYVSQNYILRAGFASELWGAAYTINQGCSDDAFADFRCWLMAHGRGAW